jgi:plasmid stabilization system protein ParE
MFEIHWSTVAEETFADEGYFILRKWNTDEVEKFSVLVYDFIDSLKKNPTIGVFILKYNVYSIVISKQTTLYYRILEDENKIDLVLFWNNKQDPKKLLKLL